MRTKNRVVEKYRPLNLYMVTFEIKHSKVKMNKDERNICMNISLILHGLSF